MSQRNTTIRDRHRQQIRKTRAACGLCGQPIDYQLPHHHPLSFVVDHIIPLVHGGPDTLENKMAVHRACNQIKGSRLDGAGIVKRSSSLARPGGGTPTSDPPPPFSA